MAKILLVEDDKETAQRIAEWLELQHHKVELIFEGREAAEMLRLASYDLVILDWELPGLSGIDILRDYRADGGMTPVLMLTGKDELSDIEKGLDVGADDYLVKPFAMRELGARIRAVTRRATGVYERALVVGDVELDTESHKVTKAGQEVRLQPQEFALLEFLLRNAGKVFSLEMLLERVWSSDSEASPETVRVCLTRLRNKIDTPGQPSLIRTVHRMGYQIDSAKE